MDDYLTATWCHLSSGSEFLFVFTVLFTLIDQEEKRI